MNVSRQADEEEDVGIMTRSQCEYDGKTLLVIRERRKVYPGVKGGENNGLKKDCDCCGTLGL